MSVRSGVFDAYSRYYDLLYRDKDYAGEAAYIAGLIGGPGKRILELGCGTGAHAALLAGMGHTVHGVDRSDAMLAGAARRRSTLPADVAERLTFGEGDATAVRTGGTYDVVTSLFHVASYQTTDDALRRFVDTAYVHLDRGGLFIFDFWYGPAVLLQRPDVRVKRLEDDRVRVTRIAEPEMHVNANVVDVNYDVFVEEKAGGTISEIRESHHMRYLFAPELAQLRGDRFGEAGSYEWMARTPMSDRSWAGVQVWRRK
jgi:SAM-dependent methyltransferase